MQWGICVNQSDLHDIYDTMTREYRMNDKASVNTRTNQAWENDPNYDVKCVVP